MKFTLGQILNISTGRLLTNMGDIYTILNYMTGEDLMTHQLPRASRQCEPIVLLKYPQLQKCSDEIEKVISNKPEGEKISRYEINALLAKWESDYGNEFELDPLVIRNPQNPIQELVDMVGTERILAVGGGQ